MKKIVILSLLILYSIILQAQSAPVWSFNTSGSIHAPVLIENEKLYVGSTDSVFYALNKNTGKEVWRYKTKGAIKSSASLQDDIVLFSNAQGVLFALDKNRGNLLWTFKSQGETLYDLWDYHFSSPKIYNNKIYWGSGDGHFYCIDLYSGKLVWSLDTEAIIHSDALFFEDKVFIGNYNGNYYALNADNGTIEWQFQTVGAQHFPKGELQGSATLHNGIIYVGSRDYNIYALDAKTGRAMWNKKMPSWVITKPLIYDNTLYYGISDGFKFYAVNPLNGKEKWEQTLPFRIFAGAVGFEDNLYVGCLDGKLYTLDKETGEIKTSFASHGHRENHKIVFDTDGKFQKSFLDDYAEDMTAGEQAILNLGSILSTPVIEEGILYFSSTDGAVYALKL